MFIVFIFRKLVESLLFLLGVSGWRASVLPAIMVVGNPEGLLLDLKL